MTGPKNPRPDPAQSGLSSANELPLWLDWDRPFVDWFVVLGSASGLLFRFRCAFRDVVYVTLSALQARNLWTLVLSTLWE